MNVSSLCLCLTTWIALQGMLVSSASEGNDPALEQEQRKSTRHRADIVSMEEPTLTLEFRNGEGQPAITIEESTPGDETVSGSESATSRPTATEPAQGTESRSEISAITTTEDTASDDPSESDSPSPPAYLRVLPLSETSVLLTWLPVPDYVPGSRYRVRAVTPDEETSWMDVGLVMTARISDVDPSKNYTFEVQWCSEDDVCSRPAGAFFPATAPSLPGVQNLTVMSVNESSINVTWNSDDSGASDGFLVSWCLTSMCYSRSQTRTEQTAAMIDGLRDYTSYTVFVSAVADEGLRMFTGRAQNVTVRTEPAPPSSATSVPWGFNGITLFWLPKYQQVWGSRYRARVVAPVRSPGKWMVTRSAMITFSDLAPSTAYEFELEWCPSSKYCSRPVIVEGSTL